MRLLKRQRQLLNKRLKSINSTLSLCGIKRDICYYRLKFVVDRKTPKECQIFINKIRDSRHNKVRERHKGKFNRLLDKHKGGCQNNRYMCDNGGISKYMYGSSSGCQSNNIPITSTTATNTTTTFNNTTTTSISMSRILADNNIKDKWVFNCLSFSFTEVQELLLAMGPNFAVAPRCFPKVEYTATVEEACLCLLPKEVVKLRTVTSHLLKRECLPTQHQQGRRLWFSRSRGRTNPGSSLQQGR